MRPSVALLPCLLYLAVATWGLGTTSSQDTDRPRADADDRALHLTGDRREARAAPAPQPRAANGTQSRAQTAIEQVKSRLTQLKKALVMAAPILAVAGILGTIFIIVLVRIFLHKQKKNGFTLNYYKPGHDFAIRIDYGHNAHYDPSQYPYHEREEHGSSQAQKHKYKGPKHDHHSTSKTTQAQYRGQQSQEAAYGTQAHHGHSPIEHHHQESEKQTSANHGRGNERRKNGTKATPVTLRPPHSNVFRRLRGQPAGQQDQW